MFLVFHEIFRLAVLINFVPLKKKSVSTLSRPRWPFWGPLSAIMDLAGGTALQAVSECFRRRQAGIGTVCARVRGFRQCFSKGQRGCEDLKIVYISIFSQIRSEGGGSSNLNFFPNSKQSTLSLGVGQENYGLFPNFVTFLILTAPLSKETNHLGSLSFTTKTKL